MNGLELPVFFLDLLALEIRFFFQPANLSLGGIPFMPGASLDRKPDPVHLGIEFFDQVEAVNYAKRFWPETFLYHIPAAGYMSMATALTFTLSREGMDLK